MKYKKMQSALRRTLAAGLLGGVVFLAAPGGTAAATGRDGTGSFTTWFLENEDGSAATDETGRPILLADETGALQTESETLSAYFAVLMKKRGGEAVVSAVPHDVFYANGRFYIGTDETGGTVENLEYINPLLIAGEESASGQKENTGYAFALSGGKTLYLQKKDGGYLGLLDGGADDAGQVLSVDADGNFSYYRILSWDDETRRPLAGDDVVAAWEDLGDVERQDGRAQRIYLEEGGVFILSPEDAAEGYVGYLNDTPVLTADDETFAWLVRLHVPDENERATLYFDGAHYYDESMRPIEDLEEYLPDDDRTEEKAFAGFYVYDDGRRIPFADRGGKIEYDDLEDWASARLFDAAKEQTDADVQAEWCAVVTLAGREAVANLYTDGEAYYLDYQFRECAESIADADGALLDTDDDAPLQGYFIEVDGEEYLFADADGRIVYGTADCVLDTKGKRGAAGRTATGKTTERDETQERDRDEAAEWDADEAARIAASLPKLTRNVTVWAGYGKDAPELLDEASLPEKLKEALDEALGLETEEALEEGQASDDAALQETADGDGTDGDAADTTAGDTETPANGNPDDTDSEKGNADGGKNSADNGEGSANNGENSAGNGKSSANNGKNSAGNGNGSANNGNGTDNENSADDKNNANGADNTNNGQSGAMRSEDPKTEEPFDGNLSDTASQGRDNDGDAASQGTGSDGSDGDATSQGTGSGGDAASRETENAGNTDGGAHTG